MIVHVTAIQPSAPQPYEKVAADVKAHVSDQQRRDATRQQVVKLRSAITALSGEGKPAPTDKQYQELFRQFHLTPRRVSGISRPTPTDKTVNGLPVSLVQAIFERQVGNVAGPLALDNGGQMLAIVTANHHPAPETLKEKSGAAQEQHLKELSAGLNQSVQNQTLTSLLKRYPVVVNQKLGAATSDTGGE